MIVPKEPNNFFGLGGIGEGGKAAQIYKYDSYLTSMTIKQPFLS